MNDKYNLAAEQQTLRTREQWVNDLSNRANMLLNLINQLNDESIEPEVFKEVAQKTAEKAKSIEDMVNDFDLDSIIQESTLQP